MSSCGTTKIIQVGSGSGANLTYTASPIQGVVLSDSGTDAIIPLADLINAGLMSPAQVAALSATTSTNAQIGVGNTYIQVVDPITGAINFVVDGVVEMSITPGKITIPNLLDPKAYIGSPQTIVQRDALTATTGMLVWVVDGAIKEWQYYDGTIWKSISNSTFANQTEVTAGVVTDKIVAPNTLKFELDKKLDDSQLIDDDSFVAALSTNIASAESTKAYVDAKIVNTNSTLTGDGKVGTPLSVSLSTDAGQTLTLGTDGKLLSIATPTEIATVLETETGTDNVKALSPLAGESTYIKKSILNAKGDIITATAGNTPSILTAGTDGQVLTADSTEVSGLKWITSALPSTQPLTYGRVLALLDLASTTHINTDPGTKIPFTGTVYTNGMTTNAGSIIPSVSGRYRADWLCMATSTDFLADGIFFVVQNGASVGQVSYNMNEASAVNQSAGFIDVNLVAGQEVSLHYRTRHTASDGIAWDRGSYFQLTQLPTAVAPVVNTVAEYGEQILASTPIVNTTADITNGTFTLPSAGVWDVEYFVFAATIGGNETATVFVTDPSNIVVANSYAKTGTVPTPAGNTGNMVSQKVRIITTGATNYKLRATTAGTQVTLAAGGATSKVSWTKIAGQLSSSISTDATFANPNNLSVPTTQATKTYVDSKISNNTNYVDIGTTRIQWGTNTGGAGVQTYSFPVPFANNTYVITANAQSGATTFLESIHLERVSASQFQAVAMYVDGGNETPNNGRTFFWTAIGQKP